jgi:hypothetical protein
MNGRNAAVALRKRRLNVAALGHGHSPTIVGEAA